MPTGYTAAISEGITFNDFIMRCARGMGALIMMRDEPFDAPIPERFEPSDYHATKQAAAEAAMKRLREMSDEEAGSEARQDFERACAANVEAIEKNERLRDQYETMLAQVKAWNPPTADHHGLKKFMIEQITGSIDFDCDTSYYRQNAHERLSATAWREAKLAEAQRDYDYHSAEHRKEVERTESRNQWLKLLRESL